MDTAAHVAEIAEQGFTIIEDAIDPDHVDALADDLLRLERDLGIEPATNSFEGEHTWRIYNLLVHGDLYERIPVHPNVLPVVEGVLDSGCLVSSLSSIAIGPGESAQPIHADDQLIPLPKPHPPTVCNTMWALTDFTEANGATRLVPGSHLLDHSPNYGPGLPVDPRRDGEGIGARVARQPLARRRREPHRRAPRRHRHELLRGLHPPAGEPAARHPDARSPAGSRRAYASSSATASTTGSSATSTSTTRPSSLSTGRSDTSLVWDAV